MFEPPLLDLLALWFLTFLSLLWHLRVLSKENWSVRRWSFPLLTNVVPTDLWTDDLVLAKLALALALCHLMHLDIIIWKKKCWSLLLHSCLFWSQDLTTCGTGMIHLGFHPAYSASGLASSLSLLTLLTDMMEVMWLYIQIYSDLIFQVVTFETRKYFVCLKLLLKIHSGIRLCNDISHVKANTLISLFFFLLIEEKKWGFTRLGRIYPNRLSASTLIIVFPFIFPTNDSVCIFLRPMNSLALFYQVLTLLSLV